MSKQNYQQIHTIETLFKEHYAKRNKQVPYDFTHIWKLMKHFLTFC